jgi:hypothetical protein
MCEICGIKSRTGRIGKKNLKIGPGAVPGHIPNAKMTFL